MAVGTPANIAMAVLTPAIIAMFWGIIIELFGLVSDRDTGLYSYNESNGP